ncbi:MAG: NYN domain-containing protein [Azoarcus sp.]|nr:NYN domain-containing protein [Azoarcus sp.]
MASPNENISMALFCDFENVALGVRDANFDKFDIKRVLERLLLKGSITVKKAYCDWDRYKGFKAAMHEANFELIEIPHVRQSGKNSADIRLVVDALDLCYTKAHVNTFVIISGDSDFSPLVSKLRENAKQVIGVGVKQSTSDLLIANCDEFIFYDDLVRESQRAASKRDSREAQPASKRNPAEEKLRKEELDARRTKAIEIAVETFEALLAERGDSGKIWASMLKEAIKRRKPDFSESYFGFRAFGNLLEEAQARGLLEFGRDEKSGAYVYRSSAQAAEPVETAEPSASPTTPTATPTATPAAEPVAAEPVIEQRKERDAPRTRKTRPDRNPPRKREAEPVIETAPAVMHEPVAAAAEQQVDEQAETKSNSRRRSSGGRRTSSKQKAAEPVAEAPVSAPQAAEPATEPKMTSPEAEDTGAAAKPARKPSTRNRRPRKKESAPDESQG